MPVPVLLVWIGEEIPRRNLQGLPERHVGRLSQRAALWPGEVLGLFAIQRTRRSGHSAGAAPDAHQVQNC